MSLVNRAFRVRPTASDQAIERSLTQLAANIEPDPVFRLRLRSYAVNAFVAVREGISPARPHTHRGRTGRVPRACLYAGLALGVSAASVLAASQEALPGDVLFALRQRIEELRWDVVSVQLQGEPAGGALDAPIDETGRRADVGVPDLAAAADPSVDGENEGPLGPCPTMEAAAAARLQRHLLVVEGLHDTLRARAHAGMDHPINDPQGIGLGSEHEPRFGRGAVAGPGTRHGTARGVDQRPIAGPNVDRSRTMPPIQRPEETANTEPAGPILEPSIAPALFDPPHQPDTPIAPPAHDHAPQTEQTSLPAAPAQAHDAGPADHAENQKTE